jgi:hypothetical protein
VIFALLGVAWLFCVAGVLAFLSKLAFGIRPPTAAAVECDRGRGDCRVVWSGGKSWLGQEEEEAFAVGELAGAEIRQETGRHKGANTGRSAWLLLRSAGGETRGLWLAADDRFAYPSETAYREGVAALNAVAGDPAAPAVSVSFPNPAGSKWLSAVGAFIFGVFAVAPVYWRLRARRRRG